MEGSPHEACCLLVMPLVQHGDYSLGTYGRRSEVVLHLGKLDPQIKSISVIVQRIIMFVAQPSDCSRNSTGEHDFNLPVGLHRSNQQQSTHT